MKQISHWATTILLALMATSVSAGLPTSLWTQQSHVEDAVIDNGSTWNYQFTVFNDSCNPSLPGSPCNPNLAVPTIGEPIIIDWELPYYSDMGIANIANPAGWGSTIETIGVANPLTGWSGSASWMDPTDPWYPIFGNPDGPFGMNNLTQVLHWYVVDQSLCGLGPVIVGPPPCAGIAPLQTQDPGNYNVGSLGSFGFDADFAPAAAPYSTSWAFLPSVSGDPAFPFGGLPGSPSVIGVSSPSVLILLIPGLLGLAVGLRRKLA